MARSDKSPKESKEKSNRRLVKADFIYDEEHDSFRCPGEQNLKLIRHDNKGKCVYPGDISGCASCQYQSRCGPSKSGPARTLHTDRHEGLRPARNKLMELLEKIGINSNN